MKITTLVSSAALSLLALTGVASAQSTVPGSDYYREAQADARANEVIRDQRFNDSIGVRTANGAFGYPTTRGALNIVPGSDHYRDARADARANSVIQGTLANEVLVDESARSYGYPAPSVRDPAVRAVGRDTVPGSDYYRASRADARANSVVEGTRANAEIVR